MKIIAQIPQGSYRDPNFVAEISTAELEALLALAPYAVVEVTSPSGVKSNKAPKEFSPGDTIDPSASTTAIEAIRALRSAKEEIAKASATLKGALTKLGNTIP